MFNLIPWKKRNGGTVAVRQAEPSRQESGYYPLGRFREEFDTLMSRFFDDPCFGDRDWGLTNPWNSSQFGGDWDVGFEDKEKEYVVCAELPGFEPDDFDVKVSGDSLTVRAEHKDEKKDKDGGHSYRYGSFSRTFTLPHGVDGENIDARYHSGVLELRLPKTAQAQGKRITVTAN